ncbi:jerky protein homolog-like [Euwallacea similis]|uniref:jerky protein homolog-like n=1 Tax=Euwallacea similis TaxID=1736056 RepID=UPI00344C2284
MGKLKKTFLSLREKANILEEHNKGMSVTMLSKKYGVAKSTICGIKKKKILIMDTMTHTLKPSKKCTLKKSAFPLLEQKLYDWFLKQREKNLIVSGDMLKQKALLLSKDLKMNTIFTASDGWLQRFKHRRGIRFLKITGEKLSSNPDVVDPFKENLKRMIEEHELNCHQIYNADETGLYWQLLPDKTYVALAEKTASGLKISKQRLTFMGCVNASGCHKLKPLVIGKSKNPRCFKNFINPVVYKSNKNAWMTGDLFKTWYFQHFVPEVRCFLRAQKLPQKAILLLDNAPSHPPATELTTEDGMIFVKFLPPNVTPLLQPMDQNILRLTKVYYRKSLLSSIVSSEEAIAVALKKISLKDAILHLSAAWDKLDVTVIKKCWKNIFSGFDGDKENEDEDNLPLSILQLKLRNEKAFVPDVIKDTINLLQEIAPAEYSAADVEDWTKDEKAVVGLEDVSSDESDNDNESGTHIEKISHSDVIRALNMAIEWCNQNSMNISEIITLKKILEQAIQKTRRNSYKNHIFTSLD